MDNPSLRRGIESPVIEATVIAAVEQQWLAVVGAQRGDVGDDDGVVARAVLVPRSASMVANVPCRRGAPLLAGLHWTPANLSALLRANWAHTAC